MGDRTFLILTIAAAVGCGLMGGLFFAFSTSVMRGLGRIPPSSGIQAMQSINIVIQNPVFFVAFFGPAVLAIALSITSMLGVHSASALWIHAGAAFYLVGIMAITIVVNVPMNEALAAADPASAEGARLWAAYLDRWTAWNHVRTVAGLLASVAYVLALL